MSDKRYKQKTKFFGIPVPGYGDRIWPELELQKFQIIENMLKAGLRGAVNAVFDEGDMTVKKAEDGSYSVLASATGSHPSVEGTVGGAYFKVAGAVSWDKMVDGTDYFLYLRGSSGTFSDPSDVRPVASTRRLSDGVSVLVAKVSLKGDMSSLDRAPDGKVRVKQLERHLEDWDSPHGEKTAQEELLVRQKLVLGQDCIVEVGLDASPVSIPASVLAGSTRKVVDFASGGPEGAVLECGGRAVFAIVSRVSNGTLTGAAGEVSVGYFGADPRADRPDRVVVRNSGDKGISMRAMVFCG